MDIGLYHPWIKSKGGAERLIFEYAGLSEHNVDLLTHYYGDSFEKYGRSPKLIGHLTPGKNLLWRGMRAGTSISTCKIDEEKYDALIVSESGLGSLITLRNNSLPLLCYCHTPLRAAHTFYPYYQKQYSFIKRQIFRIGASMYRMVEKQAWKQFDRVLCNSKNTLKTVHQANLAPLADKKIVYPGINTDEFTKGDTGNYFFYPSRFKTYKRQELAIAAFQKFNSSVEHDFKLILAGQVDDEDYLEYLRDTSGENVEFTLSPSDKEMRELYSNCFAVLFTAYREDWGIVPLEAMASGKPVIAVNEGGPTESVINGETGYLTESRPSSIARSMLDLYQDKETYNQMSENALSRSQEFTWEAFAQQVDREVEKLV